MIWKTLLCLTILLSQGGIINRINAQNFTESGTFPVGDEDTQAFMSMLYCDYDVSVSSIYLKGILTTLTFDTSDPCNPILPNLTAHSATSMSYEWEKTNAQSYTVASLGLEDGTFEVHNTTKRSHLFKSMSPQTYLLFFIANCLEGSSIASIIIADKDVFQPVGGTFDEEHCSCTGNEEAIVPSDPCEFFTAYSFPWNNSCNGNKYGFTIDNNFADGDREFWLINYQVDGEHYVVVSDCSDGYNSENGQISETGNFWVNFSEIGAHIYMENPAWMNATVTVQKCECYDINGDGDYLHQIKPKQASSSIEQKENSVYPNPFTDKLQIQWNSASSSAKWSLIDAQGRQFASQSLMTVIPLETTTIETGSIPVGVYYLITEESGNRTVQRLVKI